MSGPREILEAVRDGEIAVEDALLRLKQEPFCDLGFAKIDTHREIRCGFPEVVFCEGKTADQVVSIAERILESGGDLLATRADEVIFRAVQARWDEAVYHDPARAITIKRQRGAPPDGTILLITAGTADVPVAEEARVTAEMMDNKVKTLYDVGVAGIHRLLAHSEHIFSANVIIVVAGMEGALASVVGGLSDRPVIAVPTSVGYGASFGGIAPLLTMLNSCAAGVCVVNIDNGFGAGYIASLVNRTGTSAQPEPA